MPALQSLADMKKLQCAKIVKFAKNENDDSHFETRLREIGFAEGDMVEIQHIGLFGKSPINVKLHGTSIAMRPADARRILVEPCEQPNRTLPETGAIAQ